jgi:hypothetical protein
MVDCRCGHTYNVEGIAVRANVTLSQPVYEYTLLEGLTGYFISSFIVTQPVFHYYSYCLILKWGIGIH